MTILSLRSQSPVCCQHTPTAFKHTRGDSNSYAARFVVWCPFRLDDGCISAGRFKLPPSSFGGKRSILLSYADEKTPAGHDPAPRVLQTLVHPLDEGVKWDGVVTIHPLQIFSLPLIHLSYRSLQGTFIFISYSEYKFCCMCLDN